MLARRRGRTGLNGTRIAMESMLLATSTCACDSEADRIVVIDGVPKTKFSEIRGVWKNALMWHSGLPEEAAEDTKSAESQAVSSSGRGWHSSVSVWDELVGQEHSCGIANKRLAMPESNRRPYPRDAYSAETLARARDACRLLSPLMTIFAQ